MRPEKIQNMDLSLLFLKFFIQKIVSLSRKIQKYLFGNIQLSNLQ